MTSENTGALFRIMSISNPSEAYASIRFRIVNGQAVLHYSDRILEQYKENKFFGCNIMKKI